jgi:hypothetical protein
VCFSIVVVNSHHECSRSFHLQTLTNPLDLCPLFGETQVLKQVGGIGHAEACMVVDADPKGIGVEYHVGVEA